MYIIHINLNSKPIQRSLTHFVVEKNRFIEFNGYNINTTIGQLNFFKWIINNNILEYIETNIDEIEI